MNILICNVGSTSLKYKLIDMDGETTAASGKAERIGSPESPFSHSDKEGFEESGSFRFPTHREAILKMLGVLRKAGVALKTSAAWGLRLCTQKA